MGKRNKQKEPSFADMLRELTASKGTMPKVDEREERKYFLIVSEGIRTEPNYFKYLAGMLPRHLIETVSVKGAGDNTVNVVRKAIAMRNERLKNPELPKFDEVWAVYDKDDFPDKNFHEAIALAQREEIESAHSNQSFELWYILHFEFLQSALHRSDYIAKLSDYLGVEYQKNSVALIKRIHTEGNVDRALSWAYELEQLHKGRLPSRSCPYTRVYILVDRLIAYIRNEATRYGK
ncbi:RloB domain-containing protein [Chitinophaga agrisoli]|uniref:RloB domain-containing protein n=1 Tax=Chitinophaga agrisoli TaxID=2607653 RepID=A0A5B2VIC8_9BACT|nr:RloB family protein [Chitinophaga agrisoli]KAA2238831.1 RloB domain-containing protein [Chitinophaga agrisoli]